VIARQAPKRFVLAGAVAAMLFWVIGFDAVVYPWASGWSSSFTGRAPLVGEWYGEATTPTGRRQWLALDLSAHLGRCRTGDCARVRATGRVCEATGTREYEGSGHARDWRGTRFDLYLRARDQRMEGMRVIKLQGEHAGDVLRTVAQLEIAHGSTSIATDRTGRITQPAGDPDTRFPINLILRKSGEADFQAACRRLASQLEATPRRAFS
jgi:hypothetical protein